MKDSEKIKVLEDRVALLEILVANMKTQPSPSFPMDKQPYQPWPAYPWATGPTCIGKPLVPEKVNYFEMIDPTDY